MMNVSSEGEEPKRHHTASEFPKIAYAFGLGKAGVQAVCNTPEDLAALSREYSIVQSCPQLAAL